jgi:hypothetical protein
LTALAHPLEERFIQNVTDLDARQQLRAQFAEHVQQRCQCVYQDKLFSVHILVPR